MRRDARPPSREERIVPMPIYFYIPDPEAADLKLPMDAERLLRCLGVTGRLAGFRQAIYMVERVREDETCIQSITKCLYPETAKRFGTSAPSVERNLRTVIRACWKQVDHNLLEHIAGSALEQLPTNKDFIDMLAGFLRRLQ